MAALVVSGERGARDRGRAHVALAHASKQRRGCAPRAPPGGRRDHRQRRAQRRVHRPRGALRRHCGRTATVRRRRAPLWRPPCSSRSPRGSRSCRSPYGRPRVTVGPALRRFLAPVAIVVVPSVLAIPGLFTSIRASNFALVTRTSVWNVYPFRGPLLPRFGDGAVTQLSFVCVSLAVVLIACDRTRDLRDRVTGAVAAWLVLAAYVMPWYTVWALPVAAYDHPRPFARVVAAQGAVVASAFLIPSTLLANRFVSFAFGWIASVGLLGAFVYAARTGRRHLPARDPLAPVVGPGRQS